MAIEKDFAIDECRALIIKHDNLGHLCGYLGLPEGHPLHGKDYDSVPGDVHGGWTYANNHAPYEKPDGRWYLGFDCAHAGDLVPGVSSYLTIDSGEVCRDAAFVEGELRRVLPELSAASDQ